MFIVLAILLKITTITNGIDWQDGNWAELCDFLGNNLLNVTIRKEECKSRCESTTGCTHFTWTKENTGTCWMKKNAVSKNDAFPKLNEAAICGIVNLEPSSPQRTITFFNRCVYPIWINPYAMNNGPLLGNGIQKVTQNARVTYNIPDAGWEGHFWPKTECDNNGQRCAVGQSVAPCENNSCKPPADTKVSFFYPNITNSDVIIYGVNLVDGYSLPMEIIPHNQSGSSVATNCALSLNACPPDEIATGNLRVIKNGLIVQCLAPCIKWIYPFPYLMSQSEETFTGRQFCCSEPVSPRQCIAGAITKTKYVRLVNRICPKAYSYPHEKKLDDKHNCSNSMRFNINIC